jgi:DNA-binding NtrC family response regulator
LRVLAGGGYERVGGDERLEPTARIVSATHKPVRPGQKGCVLREDLYYRLAVIEIDVPPLRARKSDIPLLVAHALSGTAARAVSEEAMVRLLAYAWPGNVRELQHVVERAAALAGGEVIDVADLPEALSTQEPAPDEPALTLREALARTEKALIQRALERAGGNRSEAARLLGIGRTQLYAKMEEHGLT